MVKKADQEIVGRRLEETLDLFQPTARQAAAEASNEARPKQTPKSRRWDRENPTFSFRILPEDNERIGEWASQLEATKDEIARGLVGAALEALEDGRLGLAFEREAVLKEVPVRTPTGKVTTRRITTTNPNGCVSGQNIAKNGS